MSVSPPVVAVRRKVRVRYVVAAVVCVGVVAWLLIGGLAANIVYLRPVSYAVAHRDQQGTRTFRMAGQVVPDSITPIKGGVKFAMTEGGKNAAVDLQGNQPNLFKNCAPVVVEGRWDGTTFLGDRLLIRHGNSYTPSKKDLQAQERAERLNKKCPPAATS